LNALVMLYIAGWIGGDEPGVIGDLGNNDNGLVLVCLLRMFIASSGYDARDGHWGSCLQALFSALLTYMSDGLAYC
jgi:hypothetical protein